MPRYLLAAEADQIQDFIYRASRLREVVGGSQLLSRFCTEGAPALLAHAKGSEDRFVVNDGGAFRVVFEDADDTQAWERAVAFGDNLGELYRRCAGGNLTVAPPVRYDDDAFCQANDEAQHALRKAKSRGDASAVAVHLPYLAFCASCGVALAREYTQRHPEDVTERPNYVCGDCLHKAAEPTRNEKKTSSQLQDFLDAFRDVLRQHLEAAEQEHPLGTPPHGDWAEAVAQFDTRRYVAYLLADGNNMGTLFSQCTQEEQMRALSKALPNVLRHSLAAPCDALLQRIEVLPLPLAAKRILPVLPLILGGDDLFALLPAPWALDFALRFCCRYEEGMRQALQNNDIQLWDEAKPPTVAAAVVICKTNYPYTLAHTHGEALLAHAKAVARRLALERNCHVSTLHFAVISGHAVEHSEPSAAGAYRPTLCPYFVSDRVPSDVGLSMQHVLDQRLALKDLPGKRRAELEELYDDSTALRSTDDRTRWRQRLTALLERVGRLEETPRQRLEAALQALGDVDQTQEGCWRHIMREATDFHGHGFPDLLEAWDFTYKLDVKMTEYEGQ